jgi:hypothetical protein
MTTIVNHECEAAMAALQIAGIDRQEATQMVSALHRVLPEATAGTVRLADRESRWYKVRGFL